MVRNSVSFLVLKYPFDLHVWSDKTSYCYHFWKIAKLQPNLSLLAAQNWFLPSCTVEFIIVMPCLLTFLSGDNRLFSLQRSRPLSAEEKKNQAKHQALSSSFSNLISKVCCWPFQHHNRGTKTFIIKDAESEIVCRETAFLPKTV